MHIGKQFQGTCTCCHEHSFTDGNEERESSEEEDVEENSAMDAADGEASVGKKKKKWIRKRVI